MLNIVDDRNLIAHSRTGSFDPNRTPDKQNSQNEDRGTVERNFLKQLNTGHFLHGVAPIPTTTVQTSACRNTENLPPPTEERHNRRRDLGNPIATSETRNWFRTAGCDHTDDRGAPTGTGRSQHKESRRECRESIKHARTAKSRALSHTTNDEWKLNRIVQRNAPTLCVGSLCHSGLFMCVSFFEVCLSHG